MSSTRYASETATELSQHRWASSPDFSTSISALMAAKRIALVDDRKLRELLWFVQWKSLKPRGLRQLSEEILARFPERLTTPAMRKLHLRPGKKLSRRQAIEVRKEFPDSFWLKGEEIEAWHGLWDSETRFADDAPRSYCTDDFVSDLKTHAEGLHEHLMQLCVNPELKLDRINPEHFDRNAAGVWYFDDLLSALAQMRTESAARGDTLADTEANRQINDALGFCSRRHRMVLIEGKAGIGKTAALKSWCERQGGLARYVEVPSSNDDRSFFATIASSIGVARGGSYNGQQIKLRVEDALRASGLMLVLDEAQFLFPPYARPQGSPPRIQWIKTLFDAGTAIALIALPRFSQLRKLYATKSFWDDDQLERRLNRKVPLPDAHSKDDLMKIARARHPTGSKASWTLLTAYALASAKKQASAIIESLESAIDIAQQDGREEITYGDIERAVHLDFRSVEREHSAAIGAHSRKPLALPAQAQRNRLAKGLQLPSRQKALQTSNC